MLNRTLDVSAEVVPQLSNVTTMFQAIAVIFINAVMKFVSNNDFFIS
jgi:hypothetical protein